MRCEGRTVFQLQDISRRARAEPSTSWPRQRCVGATGASLPRKGGRFGASGFFVHETFTAVPPPQHIRPPTSQFFLPTFQIFIQPFNIDELDPPPAAAQDPLDRPNHVPANDADGEWCPRSTNGHGRAIGGDGPHFQGWGRRNDDRGWGNRLRPPQQQIGVGDNKSRWGLSPPMQQYILQQRGAHQRGAGISKGGNRNFFGGDNFNFDGQRESGTERPRARV